MLRFNSATSGAANDIENATKIARAMITMYGMSDKFGMMCLATIENQYLDGRAGLICGEDTASLIDEEVLMVINSCYEKAYNLLAENKEVLDRISEYLFEKETITGKEFMKIFREMKGIEEPVEKVSVSDTVKTESGTEVVAEEMLEAEELPTAVIDVIEKKEAETETPADDLFEEN